jgi:hypothetical protein
MFKGKFALMIAIAIAVAAPASAATYYVAQSAKTKHCLVTMRKPNGKTMTQVGTDTYSTRKDATAAMKAATECKA